MRWPKAKTTLPMPSVMAAKAVTSGDIQIYLDAFNSCKHDSLWKASMQLFDINRLAECTRLANEVADGTYRVSNYLEFTINERGKTRHIQAPAIRDRVLCRVLCQNILAPRILPHMIYDNSAAVKGKGISFARKRILTHLHRYYTEHNTNKGFILQTDFAKFFDSINHDLLYRALTAYVPEPEIQKLIRIIIDSFNDSGTGIGIGSELSQISGVVFPSSIDTYCKTVRQCKYYGRYMDDIYIIHNNKDLLHDVYKGMESIAAELQLSFNKHKCSISRIDKGFCFLKGNYRLTDAGKVLCHPCRKNITRNRRRLPKLPRQVLPNVYRSWRGGILTQFPNLPYLTLQNFDRLYNDILSL